VSDGNDYQKNPKENKKNLAIKILDNTLVGLGIYCCF